MEKKIVVPKTVGPLGITYETLVGKWWSNEK